MVKSVPSQAAGGESPAKCTDALSRLGRLHGGGTALGSVTDCALHWGWLGDHWRLEESHDNNQQMIYLATNRYAVEVVILIE